MADFLRRVRQRAASNDGGGSNMYSCEYLDLRRSAAGRLSWGPGRSIRARDCILQCAYREGPAMIETGRRNPSFGADRFGFHDLAGVNWNLRAPKLYEHALQRHEAHISEHGPLVADTGVHTGRSPKDKFIVRDANTDPIVWWDNNSAISVEHFDALLADFLAHARDKTLFAQDLYGGADPAFRVKTRVFTYLNYVLPPQHVMPMHCSANTGKDGDTAIFFGLSGTGKTTLSADPHRTLIGDDEHGWGKGGVFNFEGGCYAKAIKLSREAEPEIYSTTERFGTVMENVTLDPESRTPDFDD